MSHPSLVREDQFTWSILNSIFAHHLGYGGGHSEMDIGGIRVSRSVTSYSSNSGKSRESEVDLSWTGSDGEPRLLPCESRYAENRRNGSERNWGLGRE